MEGWDVPEVDELLPMILKEGKAEPLSDQKPHKQQKVSKQAKASKLAKKAKRDSESNQARLVKNPAPLIDFNRSISVRFPYQAAIEATNKETAHRHRSTGRRGRVRQVQAGTRTSPTVPG